MPCGNGSTTGLNVFEVAGELFIALDLVTVSLVGGSCFFVFDPVFSPGSWISCLTGIANLTWVIPDVVSRGKCDPAKLRHGPPLRGRPDDVIHNFYKKT